MTFEEILLKQQNVFENCWFLLVGAFVETINQSEVRVYIGLSEIEFESFKNEPKQP